MIEAGIAYYLGTGKHTLLDVVKRLADCIDRTFGPEEGKIHAYPGHEIIEMALVRLYEATGEIRYLHLAKYFIDERGKEPLYFREEGEKYENPFYWENSLFQYQYYQAGKPVREQKTAEGHAVRAVYLYSGMTDVARIMEDDSLMEAVETLWDDVTKRQMYITGAIGSSEYGESFTFDYDLPNDTVYGETCASIGLVFWAKRMLEKELSGQYGYVYWLAFAEWKCISGMSDGRGVLCVPAGGTTGGQQKGSEKKTCGDFPLEVVQLCVLPSKPCKTDYVDRKLCLFCQRRRHCLPSLCGGTCADAVYGYADSSGKPDAVGWHNKTDNRKSKELTLLGEIYGCAAYSGMVPKMESRGQRRRSYGFAKEWGISIWNGNGKIRMRSGWNVLCRWSVIMQAQW